MEASIASPFVSNVQNISTVIELILEGKCCLISGIQSFKYMSSAAIFELFTVLCLYYLNIDLSNGIYYLIDLFTLFPVTLIMVMFKPLKTLTRDLPHSNIFNLQIMVSVIGQLIISLTANIAVLCYYTHSPVHIPASQYVQMNTGEMDVTSYFSQIFGLTGLCSLSTLWVGILYAKGKPFKIEWWQNKVFVYFVCVNLVCQLLCLYGHGGFNSRFVSFLNEFFKILYVIEQDY